MEARGRGEGPARGRARVIRQVRGVGRVASDRVVPAGRSPHRAEYHHALELGQGQWVVLRLEGERAIRDLVAEREAARTTAVKGRQQGEIGDLSQDVRRNLMLGRIRDGFAHRDSSPPQPPTPLRLKLPSNASQDDGGKLRETGHSSPVARAASDRPSRCGGAPRSRAYTNPRHDSLSQRGRFLSALL